MARGRLVLGLLHELRQFARAPPPDAGHVAGNGDCFTVVGTPPSTRRPTRPMPLLHPHDMKRVWQRRRAKAKTQATIRKTCPALSGALLRRLAPAQHARRDDAPAARAQPATSPGVESGADAAADAVAYPCAC
jgi:hypothetical protein